MCQEEYKVLSTFQYGFKRGLSCSTYFLELMDVFTSYYEAHVPVNCVHLDFAKAFDRVPSH